MSDITIYHNPACGTSRNTLALLREKGAEPKVVEYLKTGRNAHSNAAGQMAEVVTYSTSLLNDQDLAAIATYLKSLKPSAETATPPPAAAPMRALAARRRCSAATISGRDVSNADGRPGAT